MLSLEVRIIKSVIVRVSDDIHQKLKIKVLQDKTTIQALLEKFIEEYVNESSDIKKQNKRGGKFGDNSPECSMQKEDSFYKYNNME